VNNLDESRLVTWAVHKAWRFVERAKREARRRPLAAITQNIVDDSSLNIINTGKTARTTRFSPRVDGITDGTAQNSEHTTGIDGVLLTTQHKTASRQRAEPSGCCTFRRAAKGHQGEQQGALS
jgi:hypothetical protein